MSDLISRQAAIEAIINTGSMVAYHSTSERVLFGSAFRQNEIIDIINALPPVEPTRPKGEWIDRGMRVPSSWVKKCSLCGHETDTWRWCKFCPNCGADMRGDTE